MKDAGKVIEEMTKYFCGDLKRINHLLKVYALSRTIGQGENLDDDELELLSVTAAVHDIGIKLSEQKYNSSAGKYQEIEGPAEAEKLLVNLGYDKEFVRKVCYLVGHHHTYVNIDSKPYQILVEADFLVNLCEDNASMQAVKTAEEKIFVTNTGKKLLKNMYLTP